MKPENNVRKNHLPEQHQNNQPIFAAPNNETTSTLEHNFTKVLSKVCHTIENNESRQREQDMRESVRFEWQQLALVVDRMLLTVFVLITLIMTSAILMQGPLSQSDNPWSHQTAVDLKGLCVLLVLEHFQKIWFSPDGCRRKMSSLNTATLRSWMDCYRVVCTYPAHNNILQLTWNAYNKDWRLLYVEERCTHFGRVRHLIYTFVSHASWRFEKDKIFLYIRAKIEFWRRKN